MIQFDMKIHEFTISKLMLFVLIIAVDVAVLRVFFLYGWGNGVLLIFLTLQVGLLCLTSTRGRSRLFWAGFEASGLAFMFAFSCLFFLSPWANRLTDLYWKSAFIFTLETFYNWITDPVARRRLLSREVQSMILEVVYFVPPFIAALTGGVLTAAIVRRSKGLRESSRKVYAR